MGKDISVTQFSFFFCLRWFLVQIEMRLSTQIFGPASFHLRIYELGLFLEMTLNIRPRFPFSVDHQLLTLTNFETTFAFVSTSRGSREQYF